MPPFSCPCNNMFSEIYCCTSKPFLAKLPVHSPKEFTMARLLLLVALTAIAVWLWRRINHPARATVETAQPAPMVRCTYCGIHVPRDKALMQEARWYCSQAHLDQDNPHSGH